MATTNHIADRAEIPEDLMASIMDILEKEDEGKKLPPWLDKDKKKSKDDDEEDDEGESDGGSDGEEDDDDDDDNKDDSKKKKDKKDKTESTLSKRQQKSLDKNPKIAVLNKKSLDLQKKKFSKEELDLIASIAEKEGLSTAERQAKRDKDQAKAKKLRRFVGLDPADVKGEIDVTRRARNKAAGY